MVKGVRFFNNVIIPISAAIIAVFVVSFLIDSCKKKEEQVIAPTLMTRAVTNITSTTATIGFTITNSGSGVVIIKGVCWDIVTNAGANATSACPITTQLGPEYTIDLTGLSPNTKYY